MKQLTFALLTMLCVTLYSLPAYAVSFDCKKASSTAEHLICSNPELSKLDEDLAKYYKAELAAAKYSTKGSKYDSTERVRANQIKWLTFQRNTCLDKSCLLREYKERLGCDEGYCGREHGRSDFVNNEAFGRFTETRQVTLYNPDAPNNQDVFEQTNELSIHKVADVPYLAVIDSTLMFDRGHICDLGPQLATWAQNHWVIKDTYDGKNLELRFYPVTHNGKTQLLIRDIDNHYRESACGMRGYFDGLVFERE